MLFPILPRGVESTLMIFFFLVSAIIWGIGKKNNVSIPRNRLILIILFSSVFLFSLISLIYTSNSKEGIKDVVRILPLALFPLVFGFLRRDISISKEIVNRLVNIYLSAITIGLLMIHISLFDILYFSGSTHWEIRQGIEKATDIHGTYMSLWTGFGVLILITKMGYNLSISSLKKGIPYLALICYFLYWQITIGARMPFFITLVLIMGYYSIHVKSKKSIILGFMFLMVSLFFLVYSKSNLVERVKNVTSMQHSFPEGDYAKEFKKISSEDIRKGIYFCNWLLAKESPIFGYGVGDVQDKLESCYLEKLNSNVYQMFQYNSHNQYFQVMLSAGILALVFLLLSILIPLYVAFKQKNYLWFSNTALIAICFLTENIIGRHDGVIFYGLFNAILAFSDFKNDQTNII
tara:strand:+ start:11840 stop:13057 length:1218 start_codon:yes stop_codon:yes gene_type:complete